MEDGIGTPCNHNGNRKEKDQGMKSNPAPPIEGWDACR